MEIKAAHYPLLLLAVGLLSCLATSASARNHVTASFYNKPYIPSACFGRKDMGEFVISLSDALWDHGKHCGTSYRVWCESRPGYRCDVVNSIGQFGVVVDNCGDCGGAGMLLSLPVFTTIGLVDVGEVQVYYEKHLG